MSKSNLNRTLSELEGRKWTGPKPGPDESYVVRKGHELLFKKLKDFGVEDLRYIVGQGHSLEYVMPLALDVLRQNPFAEGDLFEGDLLRSVLKTPRQYWDGNPEQRKEVVDIFLTCREALEQLDLSDEIKKDLVALFERNLLGNASAEDRSARRWAWSD